MRDLCRHSAPFNFDDLSLERKKRAERPFVALFNPDEAEAAEEEPEVQPLTVEEQARKVFDDAYVEGEKAGHEMGMRRAELVAKRLEKQLNELTSFKKTLEEKYEKLAVELALLFAGSLVLKECEANRDLVVGMIRKALQACEERGEIIIRVRNEDLRHIEGINQANVKVISDDALKEPGFVIETSLGDIDGRVASQIEELRNALVGYVDA